MKDILPGIIAIGLCLTVAIAVALLCFLVSKILKKINEKRLKRYSVKKHRNCSGVLSEKSVQFDPDLEVKPNSLRWFRWMD